MNWTVLLTSIDGRIGRKPFWIALIALSAVELAAHVLMGERWSSIVGLLLAYPEFALFAKRGHDRNVPAWVPGLFIAGAVVLNLLVLAGLSGPMDKPTMPFLAVAIPVGVLALVLLVDFGFRRGTVGPNRYGPDSLEATRATS